MRDGDPFSTQQLDEQRARQRRWLRTLLVDVLKDAKENSGTKALRVALQRRDDPAQAEVGLRAAADAVAGGAVLPDEFVVVAVVRMALTDAANAVTSNDVAYERLVEIEEALQLHGPKPANDSGGFLTADDRKVIMLLLLADALADETLPTKIRVSHRATGSARGAALVRHSIREIVVDAIHPW